MKCAYLLLTSVFVACGGSSQVGDHGDGSMADGGLIEDAGIVKVPTKECAASVVETEPRTSSAPCIQAAALASNLGRQALVRADCTNPNITALLDKPHLVMMPNTPTRDVLWVNLPGTSGATTNMSNLGELAVSEGYRFIGLAYTNANSSNSRCQCPDGPRPDDCPELVRHEVVTGEDVTPYFDMEADEAIIPRLEALLAYLATERPLEGWENFIDASGSIVWSKIAISGFSQGGGMAAFIARDHRVDRVAHFSIIGGSVLELVVEQAAARSCTSADSCGDFGICCALDDLRCESPPSSGGMCLHRVAAPWVFRGPDSDGDNHGDGEVASQATPLSRHFVYLHEREPAYAYTPDVTSAWGLGGREAYLNIDSDSGPYPAAQRLFSTSLAPNNPGCSEHQAMGPNSCQPRDANGKPAILPAWRHAMTAELGPLSP